MERSDKEMGRGEERGMRASDDAAMKSEQLQFSLFPTTSTE